MGHPISDEQDDVLDDRVITRLAYGPSGDGLLVPVLESRGVLAGFGEGERSVSLGRDVDGRRRLGILSEQVLEPGKVPLFDRSFRGLEEIGDDGRVTLVVRDGQRKVFIGYTVVESFGSVDGSVDLESDVELGTGEEFGLVRREDASESRTTACVCASMVESASGLRCTMVYDRRVLT